MTKTKQRRKPREWFLIIPYLPDIPGKKDAFNAMISKSETTARRYEDGRTYVVQVREVLPKRKP